MSTTAAARKGSGYHSFTGLFAVHESFGDGVGRQDLISVSKSAEIYSHQLSFRLKSSPHASFCSLPLSELLEHDTVGEALPADANPFQNSITSQLVQNQMRLQFAGLTEEFSKREFSHLNVAYRQELKEYYCRYS